MSCVGCIDKGEGELSKLLMMDEVLYYISMEKRMRRTCLELQFVFVVHKVDHRVEHLALPLGQISRLIPMYISYIYKLHVVLYKRGRIDSLIKFPRFEIPPTCVPPSRWAGGA